MYLTDRSCVTARKYISSETQNLRSTLPNQTDGNLVKIAQFDGCRGRQRHARHAPHEREASRVGRY